MKKNVRAQKKKIDCFNFCCARLRHKSVNYERTVQWTGFYLARLTEQVGGPFTASLLMGKGM